MWNESYIIQEKTVSIYPLETGDLNFKISNTLCENITIMSVNCSILPLPLGTYEG